MTFSSDEQVIIDALEDAIEDIERELGPNPQGVYASVRVRLDILEARINNPNAPAPNVENPFIIGNDGVTISTGENEPVSSPTFGSLYLRQDGDVNSGLYSFRSDGNWHAVGEPGGAAGGDLSGEYPNPTVAKINGSSVPTTSSGDIGKVLKVSAANTAVWSTSAAEYVTVVNITNNSDPYTALATDYFIDVDVSSSPAGPITINLPASPATGKALVIKDSAGAALTHNITISGNGHTIDGQSTYVLNMNYSTIEIIYNGTEWKTTVSASSDSVNIGMTYAISHGYLLL